MLLLNYIPLLIAITLLSVVFHMFMRLYFALGSIRYALLSLIVFPKLLCSVPSGVRDLTLKDKKFIRKIKKLKGNSPKVLLIKMSLKKEFVFKSMIVLFITLNFNEMLDLYVKCMEESGEKIKESRIKDTREVRFEIRDIFAGFIKPELQDKIA